MADKILIYGGTGGIGEALARRLSGEGKALHIVSRSPDKLDALAGELGASFTVADVLEEGAIERASEEAGEVSGLVYAAGTINLKPFHRLSEEDFTRDFRLNALGAARAVQAALPSLTKAEDAAVLMFSTVAVRQGFGLHGSIAMAKGAVEGLVRSLAAELAPKVRVNAIAPSLTDTPLASGMTKSEQMAKAVAAMHPIPRLGTARDMAALGAFLMSPDAGWITGQVYGVDGGRSTLRVKG